MKKLFILILVFCIYCFAINASQADHENHPEVVRAIKANAVALKRDSANYMRRRMNSSLLHIIEDTKKLEKAMAQHACLKTDIADIQKVVSNLRSASENADANKVAEAVKSLSEMSDGVLKKYCKISIPPK